MPIEVLNGYKSGWVSGQYIGRYNHKLGLSESVLHNPFPEKEHGREDCIRLFKEHLWQEVNKEGSKIQREIHKLALFYALGEEIKLVCYCKPKACHGDVIAACVKWYAANRLDRGREFVEASGSELEPFYPGLSLIHRWRLYKDQVSNSIWNDLKSTFTVYTGPFVAYQSKIE